MLLKPNSTDLRTWASQTNCWDLRGPEHTDRGSAAALEYRGHHQIQSIMDL